jgi:hypothetical protein
MVEPDPKKVRKPYEPPVLIKREVLSIILAGATNGAGNGGGLISA